MTNLDITEYIEDNMLRLDASGRGGGIEVDASGYVGIEGACMTAYQNYLGGGMLGAVASSRNFTVDSDDSSKRASELEDALKRYFHELTSHDDDEWESSDYDTNQARQGSAY